MSAPYSEDRLFQDLRALGVAPGDILFVHSSFKSLGPVEGGAGTVVAALERALAPDGLLLMPSFNLVSGGNDQRAANWHIDTTPSTVGWLTDYFRQMPGTVRSDHYSHSVAARGPGAREFVAEHLAREGNDSPWDIEPWGKSYGTRSPMMKAYAANGKVLMLGVNYHSSTYMHVVEVTWWNNARNSDPEANYFWINRDKLGEEYWDMQGRLSRGKVGDADCRLFHIRDFVDGLVAEVTRHPEQWFKWWPAEQPA